MAGLQQYNFFPTDLFYPRPQPQQSPAVLPLQTPNNEDHSQTHHQQQSMIKATPSTTSTTSTLVYKRQSIAVVDNKASKLSTNPLSWIVEEDSFEW